MLLLRDTIRVEVAVLVACFASVIFWKVARKALQAEHRIAFRRSCGSGMACAIRLQVLAGSLVFAISYLASTVQSSGGGALPRVPGYALALLVGSQSVFLGAAAWRKLHP